MSFITDIFVGNTRIMITGFNPGTPATELKTAVAIAMIKDLLGQISEEEFLAAVRATPHGEEVVKQYVSGALEGPMPAGVDPRNAGIEAWIQAWLAGERAGFRPNYVKGRKS
jgi:hypothetical protein